MKNRILAISAVLFSAALILSSGAFAHEGEHKEGKDAMGHGKFEEGSGSSEVKSGHEGKEYEHESKEEGSFSYRKHREETKHKAKTMQEGSSGEMEMKAAPHSEKMEEGSGKE